MDESRISARTETAEQGGADALLGSFVKRVQRRIFAGRVLNALSTDLLIALFAASVVVVLDRTLWPGLLRWEVIAGLLGAAVVVACTRSLFFQRVSPEQAAAAADHHLGLKERVATARYAKSIAAEGEWERLVVDDARRSVEGVDVNSGFPLKPKRSPLWFVPPIALGVALAIWLPNFGGLVPGADPTDPKEAKKAIAEEKKKLDKKLEELKKEAEKRDSEAKKILAMLAKQPEQPEKPKNAPEKAGAKSGNEARKDAFVQIARKEDIIKKGLAGEKFKKLAKSLEEMRGLEVRKAKHSRALQQALKSGDFKKAAEEAKKLKEELAALSKKMPSELTEEEKKKLAALKEELARLARNTPSLASMSKGLQNLPDTMKGAGLESLLKNMDQLQMDMSELDKLAMDMDMLQQALDAMKMSKQDLAKALAHKCPNCGKKKKPGDKPGGT